MAFKCKVHFSLLRERSLSRQPLSAPPLLCGERRPLEWLLQTSLGWARENLVPVAVRERRAVPAWQGGAGLEEAPVC